jgi:hypothetical protein
MTGASVSVLHRPLRRPTATRADARPQYRMSGRGPTRALAIAAALAASGCDPVFDIEGAFFPSWMISLLAGVVLTVVLRLLFLRVGIEPYLGPLPLIYTCLALLLTMSAWVLFFHV